MKNIMPKPRTRFYVVGTTRSQTWYLAGPYDTSEQAYDVLPRATCTKHARDISRQVEPPIHWTVYSAASVMKTAAGVV